MNFKFINSCKKHELLTVFAVSLVLSTIVFGNSVWGDFVFDDVAVVKNRGDLKDVSFFPSLFVSPYHQNMPKTGLYRPLTMASYAVNHYLGGQASAFHVVNIFIHALNSFLVFWLIRWLLKSSPIASASFLLFLFHPIHTEAVASIVGRAELLAFLWSMITAYFFFKNYKLLASISFLLALWSKETALATMPILLYIDIYFLGNRFWQSLRRLIILAIPLAIYSAFRFIALGKYFVGDITTTIVENQLKFVSFFERIFTALKVLFMYVERLIWPIHLSADYSYNRIILVKNIVKSPEALLGLGILVLVVWAAIVYRKERQGLGLGAILFLIPYLMISNLIVPVGTIMGERLMYFPSLGFSVFVALLLDKLYQSGKIWRRMFYIILLAVIIFYGFRTVIRNSDWKDSRTLFDATAKESPNSLITRTALAGVYIRANDWGRAKEELEKAAAIYADNSHLQNLLGIVADHEGNPELAEARFARSIELNPDAINSYINLAELYLKYGQHEAASYNFLKVIEFYPVPEYVVRYAYAQIAIGNPDEAIRALNKYAGGSLNHPDLSAAMGTAYFVKKDYEQALLFLKNARKLGNNLPEIDEMIKISEQQLSGS